MEVLPFVLVILVGIFMSKNNMDCNLLLERYNQQPIGQIAKEMTVSCVQGYVIESFFLLELGKIEKGKRVC